MKRWEILWLAFEKFAIIFSFAVTFTLVIFLQAAAVGIWQQRSLLESLRAGLACDTVTGLNTMLDDFENAVITRTIPISQTIPVQFNQPLDKDLNVELTDYVSISRPTSFVFPSGGGQINGTVYMELPEGQVLPVHMRTSVEVSQTLPVQMNVAVAIPLKETELGIVIRQLKELLAPLQLGQLEQTLRCSPP